MNKVNRVGTKNGSSKSSCNVGSLEPERFPTECTSGIALVHVSLSQQALSILYHIASFP